MGAAPSSLATNIVLNETAALMSVGFETVQENEEIVNQSQHVDVVNNSGIVSVVFSGDQYATTNVQAVQDGYFDSKINTDITNVTDVVAEAMTDAALFKGGTSEANNTVSNIVNLSYAVNSSFFQSCSTTVNLTQSARVVDNSGIVTVAFEGDQFSDATSSCVNTSKTVSDIVTQITNDTTASATAKTTSSLWSLIILITLLIVLCGLIIFVSYSNLIKLVLFLVAFAIIAFGIWLMSAWLLGAPPFQAPVNEDAPIEIVLPEDPSNPAEAPAPEDPYTNIIASGASIVLATFDVDVQKEVSYVINVRSWRNPKQLVKVWFTNTDPEYSSRERYARTFYVSRIPFLRPLGALTFEPGSYRLNLENVGGDFLYTAPAELLLPIPNGTWIDLQDKITTPTNFQATFYSENSAGTIRVHYLDAFSWFEVAEPLNFTVSSDPANPTIVDIPKISFESANKYMKNDGHASRTPIDAYLVRVENTGKTTVNMVSK